MTKISLRVADLKYIAPRAKGSIIRGIVKSFHILEDHGIAQNKLRLAHFLAQAALETAGFRTLNEYGSASYFRRRYGRRRDLGNRTLADGARYHGRGIFQLTGRANYRHYGKKIGVDLEKRPYLAARPDISLQIACVYWNSKKLSRYADANNIRKITRRINGGYNGLQGRRRYFSRAWKRLVSKNVGKPKSPIQKIQGLILDKVPKAPDKPKRTLGMTFPFFKTSQSQGSETMTNWKPYLQSRTLWANLIGLSVLLLGAFGMPAIGAEEQKVLLDGILKMMEAAAFLAGAFFRYIAQDRLS